MKASPNNVLVKISEEIRRLVFEKPIVSSEGKQFYLTIKVRESEGFDDFFAQGVSVGEVVSIGKNIKNIKVGDTVLLDYIVDVNKQYTVTENADHKIVSVCAITTYMEEDLIVPANRRKPRSTLVHKAGELDQGSLVLAIVRGDVIEPNYPYIFMEYKEENLDEFYEHKGNVVWSRSKAEPVVERKVLLSYPGADIRTGETVLIEEAAIFSRSINGLNFDVAFDHDIIAIEQ